jgi:hypothetical protein
MKNEIGIVIRRRIRVIRVIRGFSLLDRFLSSVIRDICAPHEGSDGLQRKGKSLQSR